LGEVFAVLDFGAGAILEVRRAGAPALLLPFTHDCAPIVDLAGRRIVARPLDEAD
jgi:16S rRNA processing protein RimM